MILWTLSLFRGRRGVSFRRGFASSLSAVIEWSEGCGGLVLKSLSTDVFENLALEDWIHDNVDFQDRTLLLLWQNESAVVIGRHQNPWQECNLPLMRQSGVPLARRRSGGGTVFHDMGNVNFSFFTSKKNYDRQRNLRVITGALKALRPHLDVRATERFDILLNGHYKISGTAAKLGRTVAYHHCTLLCSADRRLLSAVLKPTSLGIESNATPSVPSPVCNLLDHDPTLDSESIQDAVATQYNSEFGSRGPVRLLDPSDELAFPGIHRMARDLQSWEWRFGRTPKFSVRTTLGLRGGGTVEVDIHVKGGAIESCQVTTTPGWLPPGPCKELGSMLAGARFCPEETATVAGALLRSHHGQDEEVLARLQELYQNLVSLM